MEEEETWVCTECGYENEPEHRSCRCCGFPRDGTKEAK